MEPDQVDNDLQTQEEEVKSSSSAWDAESQQSDGEHETPRAQESKFNQTKQMDINPVISRIIKQYQLQSLRETFQADAQIHLRQNRLVVRYDKEGVLSKIKEFIQRIEDRQFSKKEIQDGREGMIESDYLKSELAKQGFYIFKYQGRVILSGRKKTSSQLNQQKQRLLSNYYPLVQFSSRIMSAISFSKHQEAKIALQNGFKSLCEHNKNIFRVERIEQKRPRQRQRRQQGQRRRQTQYTLKFVIHSHKRLHYNDARSMIQKAMDECSTTFLLVDSYPKEYRLTDNKKIKGSFFEYRDKNRNSRDSYLVVAFKRKQMKASEVGKYVTEECKQAGCKILGFRIFDWNLKNKSIKIEDVQKYMQTGAFRYSLYPLDKPYSITMQFKTLEYSKEVFKQAVELTRSGRVGKQSNLKSPQVEAPLPPNQQQSNQLNYAQHIFGQSIIQKNEHSLISEASQILPHNIHNSQYSQFVFNRGGQEFQHAVGKDKFKKIPIWCSTQFQLNYKQIQEQQSEIVAICDLISPLQLKMTVSSLAISSMKIIPIEQAYNSKAQFIEGKYKRRAYEREKSYLSVWPLHLVKRIVVEEESEAPQRKFKKQKASSTNTT